MHSEEKNTILLVDDTPDVLGQIQQLLVSKGYAVSVATSGEKALKLLEVINPDLILLDILMPGIDGFETCKKIKENPKTSDIPVIFLSAITDSFDKVKAFGLGAVDYITKPVHMDEILVRVNTHISLYTLQKELKNSNELLEEKVVKRTKDLQEANCELENEMAVRLSVETELRSSLEQIERINISLKESKEKAEESDRLKTAFLSNMSHEIRTPMNGILGFADLLKDSNLSKNQQHNYIDIIEKSGKRMLKLITDLIDISRIEEKQTELVLSNFSINSLLDDLYRFFIQSARAKGLELILNKDLALDEIFIHADEMRVNQVLSNLLENAIKFSNEGKIEYGCSRKEDMLEFYVCDTGVGIPPEMVNVIFERFRQVDSSYFKGEEGAGLGLCISKAFVDLHGGEIWVDSTPNKGSTFYFTLPCKCGTSAEIEKENQVNVFDDNSYNGVKVLIAEDDENSYLLLETILKAQDFTILHAKNGDEAVNITKEHTDLSLILMDLKMPGLNGVDATKIIKSDYPNIPIIAQSAFARPHEIENALNAGCDEYVVKPIDKNLLLEIVAKYMLETKR